MIAALLASLALAVAVAMPSAEPRTYSQSAIPETSTDVLAAQMLGTDRARDVIRFETERDSHLGRLFAVRFFHAPRPINADFCGQPISHVSLSAEPTEPEAPSDRHPVSVGGIADGLQIALAPGCRLRPGQRFTIINPQIDPAAAMAALRDFAAAVDQARTNGRLPFEIECGSAWGECGASAADARRALAALSPDQAWLVTTTPDGELSLTVANPPGRVYWDVRTSGFGTPSARLAMTKRIPAPF
jgi:hypothetical protein